MTPLMKFTLSLLFAFARLMNCSLGAASDARAASLAKTSHNKTNCTLKENTRLHLRHEIINFTCLAYLKKMSQGACHNLIERFYLDSEHTLQSRIKIEYIGNVFSS
jgi:hypothetical protein